MRSASARSRDSRVADPLLQTVLLLPCNFFIRAPCVFWRVPLFSLRLIFSSGILLRMSWDTQLTIYLFQTSVVFCLLNLTCYTLKSLGISSSNPLSDSSKIPSRRRRPSTDDAPLQIMRRPYLCGSRTWSSQERGVAGANGKCGQLEDAVGFFERMPSRLGVADVERMQQFVYILGCSVILMRRNSLYVACHSSQKRGILMLAWIYIVSLFCQSKDTIFSI